MRRLLLWGGGALVVLGLVGLIALWWVLLRDLPDVETLADYRPALTSTVLDRNGTPIGEFFEERRRLVTLDEVPEVVIQAFLAAEDDTFYQHRGVDYMSIARAASAVVLAGGSKVQGGSTITQQMVKQLLLSPEQTYTRKIRELYLAQRVEERFSKDEILSLYLNHIYFGSGAYGIWEAARTYFNKPLSDVTPGEAAMLAGLPKAPGKNSPFLSPVRAEERRLYVVSRMLEEGFIDADMVETAQTPPPLADPDANPFADAGYVTEEVRRRLVDVIGNDLVLNGGLTIETTIDLSVQQAAVRSVQHGVEELDHRRGYRGPLRQVGNDGADAEIERLGQAFGLEEGSLPLGWGNTPREAVVTRVGKDVATIAFAPGVTATVALEGSKWAHDGNDPSLHGRTVESLIDVFQVGDVAAFRILPPAAETVETPDGLQATLYQEPDAQGALLSYDIHSGDLLAMVGGYAFGSSEFNRALQARRQPGSAFKPIIYGAAITRGFTQATILHDRPVVYEDFASGFVFKPENYGRRFLGPLTMTEALARSVNNAAIHLLADVGIDYVMDFAADLGIHSPLERVLGLALGVSPVTLLEITRAYGVMAANGRYVEPRLIVRVTDRDGNRILEDVALDPVVAAPTPSLHSATSGTPEAEPAMEAPPIADVAVVENDDELAAEDTAPPLPADHVMQPADAYLAGSLLRSVVTHPRGTGRRALRLGHPVGGKTGTTNDNTDAWFVGFSADIATGVWVGIDAKEVLGRRETGGKAAAPIWIDFMESALAERKPRDFEVPDGIVFTRIDAKTGKLASSTGEATLFQAFKAGTEPTERAAPTDPDGDPRRRLRLDF